MERHDQKLQDEKYSWKTKLNPEKRHLVVTSQASSHPSPSLSNNNRISSGIARVG
jgi:hypothetical protein